jgi:hypothetical protein
MRRLRRMSPLEQRRFAHMLKVALAEAERLLEPALTAPPGTATARPEENREHAVGRLRNHG